MADQHDGMEMKAHESTYDGFLNLLRFGLIGVVIVTVIVILLIAS